MVGQTDLTQLLATMAPDLNPNDYVFVTLADHRLGDVIDLDPLATLQEKEGLSLILERTTAERQGLHFEQTFKCITLTVHSSLEAVGLTAAIAQTLGERAISANVVAAFYHDHIFIPSAQADQAMSALRELAHEHQQKGDPDHE